MEQSKTKSIVDVVFILSLLGLLLVAGVAAVVFGAKVYSRTADTMENNFSLRTGYLYITNKIHSFDYEGGVNVSENGLVFKTFSGDSCYYTYLYEMDGFLKELTVSEINEPCFSEGTDIMELLAFDIEIVNDRLLKIRVSDENNESDFYVSVLSGVTGLEDENN